MGSFGALGSFGAMGSFGAGSSARWVRLCFSLFRRSASECLRGCSRPGGDDAERQNEKRLQTLLRNGPKPLIGFL